MNISTFIIRPLTYLTVFAFIIPLSAGIGYFRRLDHQMKLLAILMVLSGISETTSFIISEFSDSLYFWVYHIYFPVEYTFFALIFSAWIKNRIYSKAVKYSIPVIWAFAIFNSLFIQNLNELNSYPITLALIIYTIMALYVLYQVMAGDLGHILKNHIFWVSTGLLIFSAGDLAYFAFHPLVKKHYLVVIWEIHSILNVTTYIFYFIGIVCQGRKWE
jgi:hypothetical protein